MSNGDLISLKDSYGNLINDESHIGNINPYRYRSYYYDRETNLYYLNSRYYNPKWGRFINADCYPETMRGMFSNNMYLYTENNPINRIDVDGKLWYLSFIVVTSVLSGLVTSGIKIGFNIAFGEKFYNGLAGAALSGMFCGAISATPFGFSKEGVIVSLVGGSYIDAATNEIVESIVENRDISVTYINNNVVIGTIAGALSNALPPINNIGENFIRPQKLSTIITGKYQRKLIENNIFSTIASSLFSKTIENMWTPPIPKWVESCQLTAPNKMPSLQKR